MQHFVNQGGTARALLVLGSKDEKGSFFVGKERRTMSVVEEIQALRTETMDAIAGAADSDALNDIRIKVVGKSGTLTAYLRSMGQIPADQRAEVGKTVNAARNEIEEALESKKAELKTAELEASMEAGAVDITLPGRAQ